MCWHAFGYDADFGLYYLYGVPVKPFIRENYHKCQKELTLFLITSRSIGFFHVTFHTPNLGICKPTVPGDYHITFLSKDLHT